MQMKNQKLLGLLLLLMLLIMSLAAVGEGQTIDLPVFTESRCVWDETGNLISETAYDVNGEPALNSRGFYRAAFTARSTAGTTTATC